MSSVSPSERASLNQVARELQVHVSSIWRWALKGVRGRRLRTIMIGGRRYVERGDLERFLNEGRPRSDSPDRNRRADDAGRILDSMRVRPARPSEEKPSPSGGRHSKQSQ